MVQRGFRLTWDSIPKCGWSSFKTMPKCGINGIAGKQFQMEWTGSNMSYEHPPPLSLARTTQTLHWEIKKWLNIIQKHTVDKEIEQEILRWKMIQYQGMAKIGCCFLSFFLGGGGSSLKGLQSNWSIFCQQFYILTWVLLLPTWESALEQIGSIFGIFYDMMAKA